MKRSQIKRKPRPSSAEERAWYAKVHQIENCVLCGRYGIQVAHRNEGAGMGQKAGFHETAALCQVCHYAIDDGSKMPREQRRALMDEAIEKTKFLLELLGD